ncbi:hypothetical protein SJT38_02060, partial [Aeromonas caviae]|uniref:hypothetical protein n=1 Tax=Aeromonas caviae TaxID=648 RepID=UPI0029D76423
MMPPSFYCKPRWIKAGGRSTGHSLAPSTQIQFMNNQSKKCLSEQHCGSLTRAFLGSSRDPGKVEVDRQGAGKLVVAKHTTTI